MKKNGFTLIELLIVVALISILSALALMNFRQAQMRALIAADAGNLHTLATALQQYYSDHNTLPPADRQAGPFMSHTIDDLQVGNGPAAGGSWDSIPWLLVEQGYISDWKTLFCPKYLRLYDSGRTLRGDHLRYHNFRYAYNSSALSTGGHAGGTGIMSGTVWLVRDLYLPARSGWYGYAWPQYPADYSYPWGEGDNEEKLEYVLYSDFAASMRIGGTDQAP